MHNGTTEHKLVRRLKQSYSVIDYLDNDKARAATQCYRMGFRIAFITLSVMAGVMVVAILAGLAAKRVVNSVEEHPEGQSSEAVEADTS